MPCNTVQFTTDGLEVPTCNTCISVHTLSGLTFAKSDIVHVWQLYDYVKLRQLLQCLCKQQW